MFSQWQILQCSDRNDYIYYMFSEKKPANILGKGKRLRGYRNSFSLMSHILLHNEEDIQRTLSQQAPLNANAKTLQR